MSWTGYVQLPRQPALPCCRRCIRVVLASLNLVQLEAERSFNPTHPPTPLVQSEDLEGDLLGGFVHYAAMHKQMAAAAGDRRLQSDMESLFIRTATLGADGSANLSYSLAGASYK